MDKWSVYKEREYLWKKKCDICQRAKLQNVEETKQHLNDRFGEHRCAIKEAIKQRQIGQSIADFRSFYSSEPFSQQHTVELTPLELINFKRDGIGKAGKAFLISKTVEPKGMNRRDET